jgi:hypothetical protein
MTGTPYSYRTLQGGAAGLSVPVPFPFISRSHVQVFANLSLSEGTFDQLYISGTDYNWINDGQISMVAVTTGKTLTVIRGTPIDAPLTTWTDGSNIDASDLLISDLQNLYAVQENLDKANVSVSISLSTSQQLGGQLNTVTQEVTQQNAALLAQVNAANAALLAQVNAANAAVTSQILGVNASLADVRLTATGACEVGQIGHTTSPTDPLGWGPAIGATVSRVAFAELFLKHGTSYGAGDGSTTFVAGPDLRGVILRGLDNGRGLDPGRVKGSYQADQNKEIVIPYREETPQEGTGDTALNPTGTGSNLIIGAGQEARPKNVAERAIMKYHSLGIPVNLSATTTHPKLVGKDPGYGSVILHLPLTTDTGLTDVSGRSLSVTPQGNTAITTAQSRWGGGSAFFDNTGDWLTVALADAIGLGPYTIRFWLRPSSISNDGLFSFTNSGGAKGGLNASLYQFGDRRVDFASNTSETITNFLTACPAVGEWAFFQQTRNDNNEVVTSVTVQGGTTSFDPGLAGTTPRPPRIFSDNFNQTLLDIGLYTNDSFTFHGHMNDFQVSLTALPHVVPTGPLPRG